MKNVTGALGAYGEGHGTGPAVEPHEDGLVSES